jgi:hypothetical protein
MAGTAKHRSRAACYQSCWYRYVRGSVAACWIVFVVGCAALPAIAAAAHNPAQDAVDHEDPVVLVREVVQNEIDSQLNDSSLWCFREQREEDGKPRKTLEVCGTKEGNLERVVAVEGRELTPPELAGQDQSIAKLISHPAQLRAKQKKEREDAEQTRVFLKLIPDAFRFRLVRSEGELVTLSFWPNPEFRPATRPAMVFHHLEGTLVLDRKHKRIAGINGLLTSEVRFLGGLLGHLDEGGTFVVKAGEVVPGHWDVILMNLELSGRAFFFKTITVHQREAYADYTPVPDSASLEQVAELLKKECSTVHTASR